MVWTKRFRDCNYCTIVIYDMSSWMAFGGEQQATSYTSQVDCPWIGGVTAMGCLCGTARWQRAYLFSHWGYKSYQPVERWFDLASSYSPKSKLAGWGDIVDVRCLWLLGARDTAELRHRKWRKQGVNESFARCKYLDWKYVPGKTCLYKLCMHFIFNIFDSLSLNNICFSCRTSFLYCPCRGCCGSSGSEALDSLGGLESAGLRDAELKSLGWARMCWAGIGCKPCLGGSEALGQAPCRLRDDTSDQRRLD